MKVPNSYHDLAHQITSGVGVTNLVIIFLLEIKASWLKNSFILILVSRFLEDRNGLILDAILYQADHLTEGSGRGVGGEIRGGLGRGPKVSRFYAIF